MADVSGMLRVGEANTAVKDIVARLRGSSLAYVVVVFALVILGAVAGRLIAPGNEASGLLGGGAGALLYALIARRLMLWRFRRKFTERGFSSELSLRLEIGNDGLLYVLGDVTQSAPWRAVSELFQSHGYWIFLVQSSPWFVPCRFFADAGAERAFVRAAVERMGDGAKGRSVQATAFAEQG
jgi:hypothetical protein